MSTTNTPECVDPNAPIMKCAVCYSPVHTCEREEHVNFSYLCQAHPEGIECSEDVWACSQKCYDYYFQLTA